MRIYVVNNMVGDPRRAGAASLSMGRNKTVPSEAESLQERASFVMKYLITPSGNEIGCKATEGSARLCASCGNPRSLQFRLAFSPTIYVES